MKPGLSTFWQRTNRRLRTGCLITAGLTACYFGTMRPHQGYEGVAAEQSSALAAPEWDPISLWRAPFYERALETGKDSVRGAVRMIADGADERRSRQAALMTYLPTPGPEVADSGCKMVRNSSMELVAQNPADTAEKIRQLAERMGGFLVKSITSGQDAQGAFLAVRVPAERFEEARAEIRKLGVRVESERMEAQDVTRQYVDLDARLRNLRVEEAQYLSIMKRANTVKDTLEVSEKLSNVRGQIEQQQAEFQALSKHWRPLYQLKLAMREGLNSLGNYVAAMASFAFLLPTILLWLMAILLGATVGWRLLRWASRVFFGWPGVVRTN